MTLAMPEPVPLEMPPGDVAGLADLVRDIAGAARCLADVDDRLLGAAATAPGWLGDDAAAAAAQLGTVTALVRVLSEAVLAAGRRLGAYAERLEETRRQVAAMEAEQREHFADAWTRWSQVPDLQLQLMIGGPAVRAVVDDVEAGEAARRRRHTALLDELADEAAATVRVLVDSCAAVGGRGTRGDAHRVIAHLAARLPGWGDLELARRGRLVAGALTAGTGDDVEAAAHGALAYAGARPFADALLAALGVDGVEWLLGSLGRNTFGDSSAVARVLAAALGGAAGQDGGPVAAVLTAGYVRADDRYGDSPILVAGMAAVLAVARSVPSGGPRTSTVAEWARQLLSWEKAQGTPAGVVPADWDPELHDPVALAVGILADRADQDASAQLLGDARVWEPALARIWPDGGRAWGEVVTRAGQEPGPAGALAVRSGLIVIGAGLFAGDPSGWTVNRDTVAIVARSLGSGLAMHVAVAGAPLAAAVDGELAPDDLDLLRGLGTVTVDREAAVVVGRALSSWAGAPASGVDGGRPVAVVVAGAYLAVQEYGQRLRHALDGFQAQQAAENAKLAWDHSVGLAAELVLNPMVAIPLQALAGFGALLSGADGTWDNGADRGLTFDRDDAATAVLAAQPANRSAAAAGSLGRQAREAFDGALRVVGDPKAPTSPRKDWGAPIVDGTLDVAVERVRRIPGAARVSGMIPGHPIR